MQKMFGHVSDVCDVSGVLSRRVANGVSLFVVRRVDAFSRSFFLWGSRVEKLLVFLVA